jgi:hypothetical protein
MRQFRYAGSARLRNIKDFSCDTVRFGKLKSGFLEYETRNNGLSVNF